MIHSQHGVVESLFILSPKGQLLFQEGAAFDIVHLPDLASIPLIQAELPTSLIPTYLNGGEPKALFLAPLYKKGKLHTIVGVKLNLEIWASILHEYLIENLEDGFLLVDGTELILFQFPSKTEKLFLESQKLASYFHGTSMEVVILDDLDLIVGMAPIPQLNLKLYSIVDTSSSWKNTQQALAAVLAILLIAGIIAGWLIVILISQLLERPLSTLTQIVKNAEQRITTAPQELLQRKDEFDALARAFGKMQEQIWGRIASLRSLNRNSYLWMEQNDPDVLLQLALSSLQNMFQASAVAYFIFQGGHAEQKDVAPAPAKGMLPKRLSGFDFWRQQDQVSLALVQDTPLAVLPEAVGSVIIIPMKERQFDSGVILSYLKGIPEEELDYAENLARTVQVVRGNLFLLDEIKQHSHTLEVEVEARTKELAQMNQRLEQRVKAEVNTRLDQDKVLIQQSKMTEIGEMISLIFHQWRQPLSSIGGLIANLNVKLQIGEVPKEVLEENLNKLNEQTQFLAQTVTDFRNFLRPNPEPRLCSLEVPIKNSLKILDLFLTEGLVNLQLSLNFEQEISTYPNEFTQVLIVLVKNALETFQEQKTESPVLFIRGFSQAGLDGNASAEVIEVQDNAGGLPDTILQNIFTPYQTTKEQGTGLGLYMCQTIVERHCKGKIKVTNQEGGACFQLSFPHEI